MTRYLTSAESLERICETDPDQPMKNGLLKTMGGTVLGAASAGMAWIGWRMRGSITNAPTRLDRAIAIAMESALGGGALTTFYLSSYMVADGLTSMIKPFGLHSLGSTYCRNGGYTNTPSWSDRFFGSLVKPVETIADLGSAGNGYILINGILVKNTSFEEIQKPGSLEYLTILDGELNGDPIRAYKSTPHFRIAHELYEVEANSVIAVIGKAKDNGDIDIKQLSEAFLF